MTWEGRRAMGDLVTAPYRRGVRLSKQAMAAVEAHLTRLPQLENWLVVIGDPAAAAGDA